jgi:hypothetical protein
MDGVGYHRGIYFQQDTSMTLTPTRPNHARRSQPLAGAGLASLYENTSIAFHVCFRQRWLILCLGRAYGRSTAPV